MAQFKIMKSGTTYLIESLGNTSQMKNIIFALSSVDEVNGDKAGEGGWTEVKEAFENFGFTVCYDRNLALLTVALFAAIARSKCQELITNAKFIINIKVKNKQGETISLGQAFLNGDGYSIYAILNHPTFKKILKALGISDKYIKKYLDRMKKITPWVLSSSKKYLEVISKAFEDMTGEKPEIDEAIQILPTVVIKSEKDFKKITRNIAILDITISDGVTIIPNYAFHDCISLEKITIPNSVTEIGDGAFYCCRSLKEITIPNSVTEIGGGAFYCCRSLKEITISNSVTEIGEFAFSNCSSLEEITIPNSVTEIGDGAFNNCISLEKITIPNSVTEIGDRAFDSCSRLKEITISNSVTEIGEFAFYCCSRLKEITIPNSVTKIGRMAFSNCSSLEEITIPNSVTEIGRWAFFGCPKDMKILGNPKPEIKAEIEKQLSEE